MFEASTLRAQYTSRRENDGAETQKVSLSLAPSLELLGMLTSLREGGGEDETALCVLPSIMGPEASNCDREVQHTSIGILLEKLLIWKFEAPPALFARPQKCLLRPIHFGEIPDETDRKKFVGACKNTVCGDGKSFFTYYYYTIFPRIGAEM